jgi:hypothetical protein
MTLGRNCVIVDHLIGKDIANGFKLHFEMSRWGYFVRRDRSARRRCAWCRWTGIRRWSVSVELERVHRTWLGKRPSDEERREEGNLWDKLRDFKDYKEKSERDDVQKMKDNKIKK